MVNFMKKIKLVLLVATLFVLFSQTKAYAVDDIDGLTTISDKLVNISATETEYPATNKKQINFKYIPKEDGLYALMIPSVKYKSIIETIHVHYFDEGNQDEYHSAGTYYEKYIIKGNHNAFDIQLKKDRIYIFSIYIKNDISYEDRNLDIGIKKCEIEKIDCKINFKKLDIGEMIGDKTCTYTLKYKGEDEFTITQTLFKCPFLIGSNAMEDEAEGEDVFPTSATLTPGEKYDLRISYLDKSFNTTCFPLAIQNGITL